ncbi:tensin-4-like [Hippoglossus hippoglossus]|uniref:tensin-4-like n=1 Tax=Hippoglossus hippoglossus TaxID=8267 RepID=UPI00148D542D|nr:tensin-4-like [Hippoglossus hippoglossus]XP_034440538.1 tensin-4-like [Hippoglossus hippoglossus]
MMPTAKGMSHMIPNHVLRVGQTIRLDSAQETVNSQPSGNHGDSDLDISLNNLNQLILDLDPTFEPIPVNKSPSYISSPADEDISHSVLVSRGCTPHTMVQSVSPSIPIPSRSSPSCRTSGLPVFSSSPTCSLPPLPCGSAPRRIPSPKQDMAFSQGSFLSHHNRNSGVSLLSMSTCSDTSYILGSTLSLASEDAYSPESNLTGMSGSFSDVSTMRLFDNRYSADRPSLTKQGHLQELHSKGAQSSPASLNGSMTDIPVLLVNGAPEPNLHINSPGPEMDLIQTVTVSPSKPFSPHSFRAHFNGSEPSMKFVMDTSKFWFLPHINRAEAEALVRDKEAGTFVVRDSTSYRGSFGLAMKVDQSPTNFTLSTYPGESSSDVVRHFLIESSTKGVRVKGSSQEPYFGSLSALVYQHTITAYALPCKLLLHSQDLGTAELKSNDKPASDDKSKTACNFIYLNAVPTEMLTGPCAVQRAVSSTFGKVSGSFIPTVVNLKVSLKGVTLTDINRKLFFRRHYPAHLLSYSGEDPDNRLWIKGSTFGARMFGFVAKGIEAGVENVCHVFAEYDPLQPCNKTVEVIQAAIANL